MKALPHNARAVGGILVLALLATGCPQGERGKGDAKKGGDAKSGDAEAAVRQVFTDFQTAVKARDGAKLWDLLAEDSRLDAQRKAKAVKEDFTKADDKQKAELAKNLDVPADTLADLDGKGYLKTKQFYGKYHEVPDSKLDKVSVSGDKAQLVYLEEDGDRVPMALERENGQWKLIVEMPK